MIFIDGTSRDVRTPEEQQEEQQQEKKVWPPPATAESSRTASPRPLARTNETKRFPGWGRMRFHPLNLQYSTARRKNGTEEHDLVSPFQCWSRARNFL